MTAVVDPGAEPVAVEATEVVGSERRRPWRLVMYSGLGVALVVELVLLAPYLEHAAATLHDIDPGWTAIAVGVELVSMGAFARMQRRMLAAGGARVSILRMVRLTYAANALSLTLPGGTALSSGYVFHRLRSWGATGPAAGFTILASGVLSVAAFALLAATGAVLAGGTAVSSVVTLALVGGLSVGLLLLRRRNPDALLVAAERGLIRSNRLLRRNPDSGVAALRRFAGELRAIHPRGRDWAVGLGQAGLNWAADLACFVAAAYAIGLGHVNLPLMLVAYVAGMGAASISPIPGGFGPADAAMILTLTSGGLATVPATAAVLLYRLVSFALIVALGWVIWAASSYADRRAARSADTADA